MWVGGGRCARRKTLRRDKRQKRDLHALDENGMVLCNPKDREAAHRAEMEGIATDFHATVTCAKCLKLPHDRARKDGNRPGQ